MRLKWSHVLLHTLSCGKFLCAYEYSEQRAHHAMLKMILHVSAYDFFLLLFIQRMYPVSFDTVRKKHTHTLFKWSYDAMIAHMKVFVLAFLFHVVMAQPYHIWKENLMCTTKPKKYLSFSFFFRTNKKLNWHEVKSFMLRLFIFVSNRLKKDAM